MEDLQYPIGKFDFKGPSTAEQRRRWIETIAQAPNELRYALQGLNAEQLDTPYRPGGWTIRQVAHHLPDSHMNSYVRFRLALTEDEPVIKSYQEDRWAELPDARTAPVETSLQLLDALHERWTLLLLSLTEADFSRTFRHPELGLISLERNLALYAWHGQHHVAQISALRTRMDWK
jgi:uncharacterized damage-inducible protein DinB